MSLIQKFSCGDVVENRYQLDIQIHQGRWGDIYRATDRLNERPVAVRFFPISEDGPADYERFSSHARELSGMSAPSIANPIDHGMCREVPYLVFRWAKGQSLDDLIAEQGALTLEQTITIISKILEGLDRAHQSRMTHGLIRPVKVVIDELDGDRPLVRVVDFQIWRFFEWSSGKKAFDESNLSRRIVRYIAPEVLDEHRVKPGSDIYATGLIIVEMLTGKQAFDDNHRVALIARQLSAEVAELGPDVKAGPEFRKFLGKLVAKDQQDRFSTAGKALKEFEKKRNLFLTEPTDDVAKQEAEEPTPEDAGAGESAPVEKKESKKGKKSDKKVSKDKPADDSDIGTDEELFGADPGSIRSLSDGSPIDGEAKEEATEDKGNESGSKRHGSLFEAELNFGDSDIELDRSPPDRSQKTGHRHDPNKSTDDKTSENEEDSAQNEQDNSEEDEELDPTIAKEIPKAKREDRIVAKGSAQSPESTNSRSVQSRRPQPAPKKNTELSTPLAVLLAVALIGLVGGGAYFFLFHEDTNAAEATETAETAPEPPATFPLVITTSPPAITVLVQGRSRERSPLELEVSEEELPLEIRVRMDSENIQERIISEPISEMHFDFD